MTIDPDVKPRLRQIIVLDDRIADARRYARKYYPLLEQLEESAEVTPSARGTTATTWRSPALHGGCSWQGSGGSHRNRAYLAAPY